MPIQLIYKDIAPGAKEDINNITVSEKHTTVSNTQLLTSNVIDKKHYATFEWNQWRLDGTFYGITQKNIPYCSQYVSGSNGLFTNPIIITREFMHKHNSMGVSFIFDDSGYCNNLKIAWYNDNELIVEKTFTPNDYQYYCEQTVELFNKVVITCYSMNIENRFLKIWSIDDGVNRFYNDADIISYTVLEKMSLCSDTIEPNTLEVTLINKETIPLHFQRNQPLYLYQNSELLGIFYVDSSTRDSNLTYSISSQDYKGILIDKIFNGGIYNAVKVSTLINSIFQGEKIEVEIDEVTADIELSGYIPICTKRDALAQVLLASCAVCDTSRRQTFKISRLVEDEPLQLTEDIVKSGVNATEQKTVTQVNLTVHNYALTNERTQVFDGDVVAGINRIEFSDPISTDNVTVSYGTVLEMGNNHCIINAAENHSCTIYAYTYEDNQKIIYRKNADVSLYTVENEKSITDATLVTDNNSEDVLDMLYNILSISSDVSYEAVLDDVFVGLAYKIPSEWNTEYTGRVSELEYSGNNRLIGKVTQTNE